MRDKHEDQAIDRALRRRKCNYLQYLIGLKDLRKWCCHQVVRLLV